MSIKIENLTHIYSPNGPFKKKALDNVSLEINDGDFVAIIGHTGSGKSTLIQHMNGLEKATSGKIFIDGAKVIKCHFGRSLFIAETFRSQLIYGICIHIVDLNGR